MSFKVLGTGKKLPETQVSNNDLSKLVDTNDEWITTRTGIKRRRVSTGETMTELCVDSAKKALENSGVNPGELDLIICATIRGDYFTPSQACLIQAGIGATCPAFDVNAACSGFLYALDVADSYFKSGKVKKVLIVAYEMMSKMVDWSDRNTCVLFGDGGGAVVLGEGDNLLSIKLTASGNSEILSIPNVQGNSPFDKSQEINQTLSMAGAEVFKFAVNNIVEELNSVISASNLKKEEIDIVLLHQANKRIIEFAKQRLGLDKAVFVSNLEEYGNTSAGSIPILLDEINRNNLIKRGQNLAMVAFGGGLTTGAAVMRW